MTAAARPLVRLFALALLLVSCSAETRVLPATQVVLRVRTDAQVQSLTRDLRVRINVLIDGDWSQTEERVVGVTGVTWPVDFLVLPKDGDASRIFEARVEALDVDGSVLAEDRGISGFTAHENRQLELTLGVCEGASLGYVCEDDPDCVGMTCRVCAPSGCDEVTVVDPKDLPTVDPGAVPIEQPVSCQRGEPCSFACVDTERPVQDPREDTATLKLNVLDFDGRAPIRDVRVYVCPREDAFCEPSSRETSFEAGTGRLVVRGLAQGFMGRLTLFADDYLPVDFITDRPIYDTAWETEPVLMFGEDLLETLANWSALDVDTEGRAIAVRVFDCIGGPARDMAVSVTDASATVAYLKEDIFPDVGASVTNETGQAVAFNIVDSETTLRARRGRTVIGELTVLPQPRRLTYVHLYPRRK